jgi:RNA polymerase sigma factor (sigma-70 family)
MIEARFLDDLRLAQNGDRQAMDRLLAVIRPHLEKLARRHNEPGCSSESTADLVQESALRIWQRLAQFQGGANPEETAAMFRDWVSQIVRHLARDKQRERHAQRREPPRGLLRLDAAGPAGSSSDAAGVEPAAGGPTPSVNVGSEEQAQLIRAALENLPEAVDREIMRLCFFEGLSLRQIAARLPLSYDKVRERYHHGLRVLERTLGRLL